ncbi:MAG: hypothetical protein LBB47_06570, partial [Spirochaetaceae bacterium]|nr:hypothetical protein [Spirochaetaceae bacterium]
MQEKKAVTRQIRSCCLKAGRKEKSAIPDEFVLITGYKKRNYALRILNQPEAPQALLVVNGKTVKLKPQKKRPANRTGKKIYTDEVIASLRLIWTFFWYKCGKLLAPLIRQQMPFIAAWPAFGITPAVREKLLTISPATIDRALKKDKAALVLKGKSLTKPGDLLKHRVPIRTFYTSQERKLPGFIQIDTVHHCGQTTSGQYILTLTATDVASGWICLYSLLNKAHRWTFNALKDIHATLPFPVREFHRKQSFRAITAASLSTRSSPTGTATPPAPSPLPALETIRKMTTVSSNRKTAPSSASISAMTAWRGMSSRP